MNSNNYLIITPLKHILFLLLLFLGFFEGSAEMVNDVAVRFKTIDKVTNRSIKWLNVGLYTAEDTNFVCNFYNEDREHQCIVKETKPGSKYLIKIDNIEQSPDYGSFNDLLIKQGEYEQEWVEFTMPENKTIVELPVVRLSRPRRKAPEQLKELTVTASKVMFYHKGDTLVYNADAFVLAEGSMLDALITQLPGVEIKENGRIYCNGKFVEKLLLNGRDLFNGNNELMLENLSAYTVKNIAVYDKLGRNSKLLGAKIDGDSQYTMDVRLKRQYANGWIVNAEGGYGTEDRYLGKLFGMWYSNNASITSYLGTNNLSDQKEPGREDGSWSPENMNGGVNDRILGGMTYTVDGPEDKWKLRGDVKYNRSKITSISNTNTQNYFDTGDTYRYVWRNIQSRNWSISTNHHVNYTLGKMVNLYFNPRFLYNKSDGRESMTEALFNHEIRNISEQMVRNIYNTSDTLSRYFINRNLQESHDKGNGIETGLTASAFVAISKKPKHMQSLTLKTNVNYINREEGRSNQYRIDYANTATPDNNTLQIFRGNPHWDKRASVSAQYLRFLNSDFRHIDITYGYYFLAERRTSILYKIDELSSYDFNSPISQLPSMREYAQYIDADQSNRIRYNQHVHEIFPRFYDKIKLADDKNIFINATIPIEIWSRVMYYRWPVLDKLETISRNNVKPGFRGSFSFEYAPKDNWRSEPSISINLRPIMSPLLYIVNQTNNTDPLNIMEGNPDLRDAYEFSINILSIHSRPHHTIQHVATINYSTVFNQFARGFVYDPATGVRTYKTYNINGNWGLVGNHQYSCAFGNNNKFRLQVSTSPMYSHSVDLAGAMTEAADNKPPRRSVNTFSLNESTRLNWQIGSNVLSGYVSGRVNRYNSSDKGFYNFTSWTCNYGVSGILNLSKNWGLSTDMTLYTRRGFTDSRLNTTDLVWNARLTKSILKGSVVLAVDAYDLLHQLSNINYMVNAQARTETVSNVIPAYVLFHVQWRFNKQPKKW